MCIIKSIMEGFIMIKKYILFFLCLFLISNFTIGDENMSLTRPAWVTNNISALANQVTGQATAVKTAFDKPAVDIKAYNTTLCDEIEAQLVTKTDLETNRKLSPTGNFTGTLNNQPIASSTAGTLAKVNSLENNVGINPALGAGTTDSDLIDLAITEALTGSRIVQIPPESPISGDMWLLDRAIEVPTNFTLILNNCYLKLKPGVNDNIIRTANVSDLSLAQNINVIGLGSATVDGNGINQTTDETIYQRIGVLFFNVNGFEVRGFKVKDTHGWGMSFESGCHAGEISYIKIDQDGAVINQDGIDIRDGCYDIKIDNISGTADDDCIALTALGNNIMQVVNDGSKGMDIHDISISNIHMKSGYCNIIDLICNDGRKTYNITINDVYDTSDKFHAMSVYGAVINIGNYDFAGYGLIRPAEDGELHNIKIDNVSGRGEYLIKFGWFANDIHISNLTARDDFNYVFNKTCAQHLPFTVRDIYVDGVYANELQTNDAGVALTSDNWRGTIFNFLDGDTQNFNAKNVNIGSCKSVITLDTSATMSKYCHFSDFDLATTSHQVYSVQNDNAKISLDDWNVTERSDIYISDVAKRGQFYPTKESPNSIIKIGDGMPGFLLVDVLTNTVNSIEVATTYYVNTATGLDTNDGLASGTAFKTWQKAIDVLPKTLNKAVTINVASGTYLENISITGFHGSGYLVVNGATEIADTHQVKSIAIINNACYVQINGFKLTSTETTAVLAARCSGIDVNYCRITEASAYPAITYNASFGQVGVNEISNRNIAIYATYFAGIHSNSNSGSTNTYGLLADRGATIVKQSAQPSGTTGEFTEFGGVIK